MRPSSLFEFRSVALNPSPNGGVIHPQVALLEKLLDLAIGKRVSQVPADSTEDDFGSKVSPLKDPTFGHDRRMVECLTWFLQQILRFTFSTVSISASHRQLVSGGGFRNPLNGTLPLSRGAFGST